MTAGVLQVEDVSVDFGGLKALRDIGLRLGVGETLGLIGPRNGAGKSTLVNVISGFQRADRGRLLLNGDDVTGMAPHKFPAKGVVRTFQSTRVFGQLSVFENVEVAALGGGSRQSARGRTAEVLKRIGLWPYRAMRAAAMPTGHAHLVGIARALALRPRFLLLDEPAAGLNDDESATLVETLRRVVEDEELGLLLIEHNMGVVTGVCERLQVIHEGSTLAQGSPEEVGHDPKVLEAYLGKQGFRDVEGD